METTHIRHATLADLPMIVTLLNELLDIIEDTEGIDRDQVIANCRKLLDEPSSLVLLAENEQKVTGLVNVGLRQSLLHTSPSALVDELIISQPYRGRGVGRKLIKAVIDHCRHLGCCEVEVSTEQSNSAAREFYRRGGFEEKGILLEKDLEKIE